MPFMGQQALKLGPSGEHVWQTDWNECCAQPGGCGRCCSVGCCAPCAFGRVVRQLPPGSCCCAGNEVGACVGYALIGGSMYTAAGLFGVPCFATPVVGVLLACANYPVRRALKAKYGIAQHPDVCPDCAVVTFCELCALCQEIREIELRQPVMMMGMVAMPTVVEAPPMMTMAIGQPEMPPVK